MISRTRLSAQRLFLRDALSLLVAMTCVAFVAFAIALVTLRVEDDARLKDVQGVAGVVTLVWVKMVEAQHAWTHEYDHYTVRPGQPSEPDRRGEQSLDKLPR
jgi:hypothetical protein